jgi:hypothetical protein
MPTWRRESSSAGGCRLGASGRDFGAITGDAGSILIECEQGAEFQLLLKLFSACARGRARSGA